MGRDRRELDKCTIYNYNNQIFYYKTEFDEEPKQINVTRLVQDFSDDKDNSYGFY
jgi:hypothetical protein